MCHFLRYGRVNGRFALCTQSPTKDISLDHIEWLSWFVEDHHSSRILPQEPRIMLGGRLRPFVMGGRLSMKIRKFCIFILQYIV
jgi:hypothetical protein